MRAFSFTGFNFMKSSKVPEPLNSVEALEVPGLVPLATGYPGTADVVKSIGPVCVFRDKLYTSRTLILPDSGRPVAVFKALVTVPISDVEALEYLKAHEEFELLQE